MIAFAFVHVVLYYVSAVDTTDSVEVGHDHGLVALTLVLCWCRWRRNLREGSRKSL
jgi:hypothetical protein